MRPSLAVRTCFALTLLGLVAGPLTAHALAEPTPTPASASDWFRDYSPADFRELAAAKREIDPADLNEELLAAAIFHETNRRRAGLKLPALAPDAKVRAAALIHSQAMAAHKMLSHGTPWQPEHPTTSLDRITQQGLRPRFVAENIAFNFLLDYESGRPFHTRQENGRKVRSYEPNGPALPRHTYVSFAEAILTQWMNSPGHRANIVSTEAEFLGVGCALAPDDKGFDTIYADQDFFSPLPEPAPPAP